MLVLSGDDRIRGFGCNPSFGAQTGGSHYDLQVVILREVATNKWLAGIAKNMLEMTPFAWFFAEFSGPELILKAGRDAAGKSGHPLRFPAANQQHIRIRNHAHGIHVDRTD